MLFQVQMRHDMRSRKSSLSIRSLNFAKHCTLIYNTERQDFTILEVITVGTILSLVLNSRKMMFMLQGRAHIWLVNLLACWTTTCCSTPAAPLDCFHSNEWERAALLQYCLELPEVVLYTVLQLRKDLTQGFRNDWELYWHKYYKHIFLLNTFSFCISL